MKNDDEIIGSLIAGGIIGAALSSLLSEKNSSGENTVLGALAGAAILATYKANQNAQKTNVPVYIEENGNLYEQTTNGEKRFIKKIEKPHTQVPKHFKLK